MVADSRGELSAGTPLPDLDVQGIMAIIPHRHPMLLIDRMTEMSAFGRAVGIKNVTASEPYFPGHFPGEPIMPGVLVVEAMAQAAATLAIASLGPHAYGAPVYFMAVDEARFRRPVRPGDRLLLEVELLRRRLGVWKFRGLARVEADLAAEAVLTAKLMMPGENGRD
jgi:3-hydroxyacyl-[acyl-carrier-protein] dehydratase